MPTALSVVKKFFPEVTKVTDGKKAITIEVTAADDRTATKRAHKTCAMAVACKRKFDLDGVVISVATAYLVKDKKATRYQLPPSVSREVVSFDRDGGFRPGEYQLSAIPKSNRLGREPQGKHQGGPSVDKVRPLVHHTEGIRTALGSKSVAE
jgi:hypothetical protein